MVSLPYTKWEIWTQEHAGRTACENRGRDWSNSFTNQGMPEITGHHQKVEERHETHPLLELSEGTTWPKL